MAKKEQLYLLVDGDYGIAVVGPMRTRRDRQRLMREDKKESHGENFYIYLDIKMYVEGIPIIEAYRPE